MKVQLIEYHNVDQELTVEDNSNNHHLYIAHCI